MQTVKIEKKKLKEILKKNLTKHQEEYKEAAEGYRQECLKFLEKITAEIKDGKIMSIYFSEKKPISYVHLYQKVLSMLDYSSDEQITLTSSEFENYVQDQWAWTDDWSASNSKYLSTRK